MFSMPAQAYWIENKINETLQALYSRLVDDFNMMATEGIATEHGAPEITKKSYSNPQSSISWPLNIGSRTPENLL